MASLVPTSVSLCPSHAVWQVDLSGNPESQRGVGPYLFRTIHEFAPARRHRHLSYGGKDPWIRDPSRGTDQDVSYEKLMLILSGIESEKIRSMLTHLYGGIREFIYGLFMHVHNKHGWQENKKHESDQSAITAIQIRCIKAAHKPYPGVKPEYILNLAASSDNRVLKIQRGKGPDGKARLKKNVGIWNC